MCVSVCVHLSVSRCAHAVRAAILEVKWLQEEHLIALNGPPPVTSSPKFNFLGASASISSKKKKVEIISSCHITKQNGVKVCSKRSGTNDADVSFNLPCKSLSWELTSIISLSYLLSSPFLLSGYMELYPWRSYRYEEKES